MLVCNTNGDSPGFSVGIGDCWSCCCCSKLPIVVLIVWQLEFEFEFEFSSVLECGMAQVKVEEEAQLLATLLDVNEFKGRD